jgi:hypothetical protein
VVQLRRASIAAVASAALTLTGCSSGPATIAAVKSITVPLSAQDLANPLRGQYEGLLTTLFPQSNPAQFSLPAWPASDDTSVRVSWRQLQPVDPNTLPVDSPDDQKFDFSVIEDALTKAAGRNMRLTLRVMAYSSCCDKVFPNNTNIAIPDWIRSASTSFPEPQQDSATPGVTQVVPNWDDPNYLDAFGQLLAALGRRYDGDERLSVFEFSGYGDWSENHISYLRDTLGAPGPSPEESVAKLGYYSQFRDQNITKASIQRLVAANVNAFPRTPLVTTALNPEIVRELLADDVTKKLVAPVGIRADCLGVQEPMPTWATSDGSQYVQSKDPVVAELKDRLAKALVITEWCQLPSGADPKSYYQQALRDVVKFHVSMTSSFNFPAADSQTPMDPALYQLWARTNVVAGYRYTAEAVPASQSVNDGIAKINVKWTNYGSAATSEKWVAGFRLMDRSGATVRTLPAAVNLKTLVQTDTSKSSDTPVPMSFTEPLAIDLNGLASGNYTLRAYIEWQQHKPRATRTVDYPPMQLAREGRDDSGSYPIAALDL